MKDYIRQVAINDFAQFLMDYGFPPKKAFSVSGKFWKKHKKMLLKKVV